MAKNKNKPLFTIRRVLPEEANEPRKKTGNEEDKETVKELEADLRSWQAAMDEEKSSRHRGAEAELDEAERERLRALGYLR